MPMFAIFWGTLPLMSTFSRSVNLVWLKGRRSYSWVIEISPLTIFVKVVLAKLGGRSGSSSWMDVYKYLMMSALTRWIMLG